MSAAPEFSIEYRGPGVVRMGRGDMTDFALTYRDNGIRIHFIGLGVWLHDRLTGYEIGLPPELASMQRGQAEVIWNRVREYAKSVPSWLHHDVSMPSFEDAWEARAASRGDA